MNKSQKNERLNIWVKERKIYEIRTKRCWERIKSTDVEDDLELEEKGTHYLLRPEERRKGWVGYRSWESSCFDNEFFIKQQVQSSAEGWWTAARSGGLRKGRRFGIDTKTTERKHSKDKVSSGTEGPAEVSGLNFIGISDWNYVGFFPPGVQVKKWKRQILRQNAEIFPPP